MAEENAVKSPCINVCFLNESDVCEGCYRSATEITQWSLLNNKEKREVLIKTRERFKAFNKHLLL